MFTDPVGSFTFPVTLIASGTGTRARAAFVTPNYFDVLGVRPRLGRLLRSDEGRDVVAVSHRFWKERFGGRETTVGEVVRIGDAAFVIGGVAPPGFGGLQLDVDLDLWIPLAAAPIAIPIPSFRPVLDIVGRLVAGLSPEAAGLQANLDYARWQESSVRPASSGAATPLALIPASHGLESGLREKFRASLGLLFGICACLWVITIVNVSGLLTARLTERSREMALCQALGATPLRLFVQLLAEVSVLMAGGLALGLLIAQLASTSIPRWIPTWSGVDIRLSSFVLVLTTVTAVLATFIVTLLHRVSVGRRSLTSRFASALVHVGNGRRFRLSTCLVGAQVALTLPLLVVAGLLAQSLHRLANVDAGFARSRLLQISVEPALIGYSNERATAYYAALIERLLAVPGIADASVSSGGALSGYGGVARVRLDEVWHDVSMNDVDERYFSTVGIRLLSGRSFDAAETRDNAGLVVVNDALARRLFPSGERAVGQVIALDRGRPTEQRMVVGVVANTTDANLRDGATPAAYLPVAKSGLLIVHVRSMADPSTLTFSIRGAAMSVDPKVPILGIESVERRRHEALQRERLLAGTSVAIGWVALGLSAVGILARVTQDVAARTREIMIRSALGATPAQIAGPFLKNIAGILVVGGVLGSLAALAAARIIQGQLYGVSITHLPTYVSASATLVLAALLSALWPLRRAWSAGDSTHLLRD